MKKITFLLASFFLSITLFFNPAYAVVAPTAPATGNAVSVPDSGGIKSALAEFKSLSRKEKKERMKEVRKALKEYKAQKRSGSGSSANIIEIICAILIPPLGVYLHEGEINTKFWIDLLLTLLFFLPGMIYALIVVLGED